MPKEEMLYLLIDDTVDIGKTPLPVNTPELEELRRKGLEYIKECMNA